MLNMETKLGDIRFSPGIIGVLVADSIEPFSGKAELLNYRGRYQSVASGLASRMNLCDEDAGSVRVEDTDEGVDITVYITVRFGVSIKKITAGIIDNIYENVEKTLGQKPAKVTVVVTGTVAKNIVKRHIEVSR